MGVPPACVVVHHKCLMLEELEECVVSSGSPLLVFSWFSSAFPALTYAVSVELSGCESPFCHFEGCGAVNWHCCAITITSTTTTIQLQSYFHLIFFF